jgi:hypothetical protein
MRIGINLVGVSYNDGKVGRYRNFKDALDGFYNHIINPLRDKGHEVVFYLYTYDNPHKEDIINAYSPTIKSTFINPSDNIKGGGDRVSNGMKTISHNYINSLEQIKDEPNDVIISTRFDISFETNIFSEFKFDFSKCNFLWREPELTHVPIVSDTFILFPQNMTQNLINSIVTMETNPPYGVNVAMHNIYVPMCDEVGEKNVKIVCDDFYRSHTNPYFTLTRK